MEIPDKGLGNLQILRKHPHPIPLHHGHQPVMPVFAHRKIPFPVGKRVVRSGLAFHAGLLDRVVIGQIEPLRLPKKPLRNRPRVRLRQVGPCIRLQNAVGKIDHPASRVQMYPEFLLFQRPEPAHPPRPDGHPLARQPVGLFQSERPFQENLLDVVLPEHLGAFVSLRRVTQGLQIRSRPLKRLFPAQLKVQRCGRKRLVIKAEKGRQSGCAQQQKHDDPSQFATVHVALPVE